MFDSNQQLSAWIRSIFLCLILCSGQLLTACRQSNQPIETRITLQAMDAPANPYREQYRDWDYWIYNEVVANDGHVQEWSPEAIAEAVMLGMEDPRFRRQMFRVDDNGCLLPLLEDTRIFEEHRQNGSLPEYEDIHYLTVDGHMEPEMTASIREASAQLSGTYWPTVPKWLADNPPIMAMWLPNGMIVTQGRLGGELPHFEHSEEAQDPRAAPHPPHEYVYDQSGNLLGSHFASYWFVLYGLDRKPPQGEFDNSDHWTVVFRDEDGNAISSWLWDGSPLTEANKPPDNRNDDYFHFVNGVRLAEFYHGQQTVKEGAL